MTLTTALLKCYYTNTPNQSNLLYYIILYFVYNWIIIHYNLNRNLCQEYDLSKEYVLPEFLKKIFICIGYKSSKRIVIYYEGKLHKEY